MATDIKDHVVHDIKSSHLSYFIFYLMNQVMWHRVPSSW